MTNTKLELSGKNSLNRKKYFSSIICIIFAALLLAYSPSTFSKFFGVLLLVLGLFFLNLKRVFFDNEFVYIGSKKYLFTEIKKMSSFDINQDSYIVLKIKQGNSNKTVFTNIGGIGFLSLVQKIIFKKQTPFTNLGLFKERLDNSRIQM